MYTNANVYTYIHLKAVDKRSPRLQIVASNKLRVLDYFKKIK